VPPVAIESAPTSSIASIALVEGRTKTKYGLMVGVVLLFVSVATSSASDYEYPYSNAPETAGLLVGLAALGVSTGVASLIPAWAEYPVDPACMSEGEDHSPN
jgi:F0F1-type ATP synthase membrane subunit c/vacuolar-type H+-ATPase subunit K